MAKNLRQDKRDKFLPIITRAFAEIGYRRSTTASLAQICGIKEAVLYRLWDNKKTMLAASLGFVTKNLIDIWSKQLENAPENKSAIEQLLSYEAKHFAEFGNYMIIFSALNETDDPQIKKAIQEMYLSIYKFLEATWQKYIPDTKPQKKKISTQIWTLIGLGTILSIGKHIDLFDQEERSTLILEATKLIFKL